MLGFDADTPIFAEGNWRAESEPRLDPIEALAFTVTWWTTTLSETWWRRYFESYKSIPKRAELQTLSTAFIIIRRVGNASTPSKSV